MVTRIPVNLPQNPYEIMSACGGLSYLGEFLADIQTRTQNMGRQVLIISNPTVFDHYGKLAIASLENKGFQVNFQLLPDGEQHKTMNSVQKIYDAALAHRLERSSTILALGGGVIGDMAGFAAATWLRGVNFVQVPTSLLAMIDAAIGGKTGVNHPLGKNLIGAFHQPRTVIIDPDTLKTLPAREFRSGMAEVIKYGVIWDTELFSQLERAESLQNYDALETEQLNWIITRSCRAKAAIVSQDEREMGRRALLNYGHTIGHAIESLTEYCLFTHGEAVALGMLAAGAISAAIGWWSAQAAKRQLALLKKAGLPIQLPDATLKIDSILDALLLDKKVQNGRIRFVLPTGVGHAEISHQVPVDLIIQALLSLYPNQDTLAYLSAEYAV